MNTVQLIKDHKPLQKSLPLPVINYNPVINHVLIKGIVLETIIGTSLMCDLPSFF